MKTTALILILSLTEIGLPRSGAAESDPAGQLSDAQLLPQDPFYGDPAADGSVLAPMQAVEAGLNFLPGSDGVPEVALAASSAAEFVVLEESAEEAEAEGERLPDSVLPLYQSQMDAAELMVPIEAVRALANTLWDIACTFSVIQTARWTATPEQRAALRGLYDRGFRTMMTMASRFDGSPGVFVATGHAGSAIGDYAASARPDELARVYSFYGQLRDNQDALLTYLNQTADSLRLAIALGGSPALMARVYFQQVYAATFGPFRSGLTSVYRQLTQAEEQMILRWGRDGMGSLTVGQKMAIARFAASRFFSLMRLHETLNQLGIQVDGFNGPSDAPGETASEALRALRAVITAALSTTANPQWEGDMLRELTGILERAALHTPP